MMMTRDQTHLVLLVHSQFFCVLDDEWKRKKRSVMSENVREKRSVDGGQCEDLRTCDHAAITKDKQAYVDCKCEWGLFRDRNVTLRKPITMNHGIRDLSMKGWVSQYDGSSELGWWQKGSSCDKVGRAFVSLESSSNIYLHFRLVDRMEAPCPPGPRKMTTLRCSSTSCAGSSLSSSRRRSSTQAWNLSASSRLPTPWGRLTTPTLRGGTRTTPATAWTSSTATAPGCSTWPPAKSGPTSLMGRPSPSPSLTSIR